MIPPPDPSYRQTADRSEAEHKGKRFVFHSPYESTSEWRDGDYGVLVRILRPPEVDEPEEEGQMLDLWEARNERTGQLDHLWGGEAWTEDGKPVIPEHAFDWTHHDRVSLAIFLVFVVLLALILVSAKLAEDAGWGAT